MIQAFSCKAAALGWLAVCFRAPLSFGHWPQRQIINFLPPRLSFSTCCFPPATTRYGHERCETRDGDERRGWIHVYVGEAHVGGRRRNSVGLAVSTEATTLAPKRRRGPSGRLAGRVCGATLGEIWVSCIRPLERQGEGKEHLTFMCFVGNIENFRREIDFLALEALYIVCKN